MLASLEVLYLACKYVFYGPGHDTKRGPHGTQF